MTPRISLTAVTKTFGSLTALDAVSLTVLAGQVHGLLGENGAGKSTLLNILSGVLTRSAGEILIDGALVSISNPRDAQNAGIAMIHQELQQVPELTVAQKIFLGANLRHWGGVMVDRADSGRVLVGGAAVLGNSPRARIRAGFGLVPEERKRDGIVRHRPIASNIALPAMRAFARLGLIRRRHLAAHSTALMQQVNLRPLDVSRPIGNFSGGNQQKAIIGRWLAAGTQIFLFDEPTRGIDVGAKSEIYALIEGLASEGRAVIVVSSELPEVIRLSDRVLFMQEGRLAATLSKSDIPEAGIARAAIPNRGEIQ